MTRRELIDSYVAAWNALDPERVAGHFAGNGVRHWEVIVPPMIGGPTSFRGPVEIAKPVRAFMTAVPDLQGEVLGFAETGDGAILEWRHWGTHSGSWAGWSGQGEPIEFQGVSIYRIEGDKLLEERMYFDPDVMARNWAPGLVKLMGLGMKLWTRGRAARKALARP
jgi:hypothetical protein